MFMGNYLIMRAEMIHRSDYRTVPISTEIRDLKAPNMHKLYVEFQGNFSPVNIQAVHLKNVSLRNVSLRHPQTVLKNDDYTFLEQVNFLQLGGLNDLSLLSMRDFSRGHFMHIERCVFILRQPAPVSRYEETTQVDLAVRSATLAYPKAFFPRDVNMNAVIDIPTTTGIDATGVIAIDCTFLMYNWLI